MLTKCKLAIAAAVFLSAVSAAQAGKDIDPEATGGFVWGPMGQRMGDGGKKHRRDQRCDRLASIDGPTK